MSRPRALRTKKNWPPEIGHWQTMVFLAKKNSIFAAFSKRLKDCQAAVYCGFSNFCQKSGRFAIFLSFIIKVKNSGKPWLAFTLGKVKMPLLAILLWLAGDRFLPRCFARLSLL